MQAKFNETMNSSSISLLEDVTEGVFCAVLYNSSWHRVQICSLPNDNGDVTCFMVDTGEQLDISKDQLCNLEPMFLKPNTQVKNCIHIPNILSYFFKVYLYVHKYIIKYEFIIFIITFYYNCVRI